jgi:SAM-dependent methyltransferase
MTNFSQEWDLRYQANTHLSVWPWSDLVGYVMRYARPDGPAFRVLELGCGAGANLPFFQALGVQYCGIEGSPSIVAKLQERFPAWKDNIVATDFTVDIPFAGQFDLVVDRSSLTHNTTAAIVQCLDLVRERLKPSGKFIGIDWFSTAYSESTKGVQAEDSHTRTGYTEGSFANVGRVHFSDKAHIQSLFAHFELLVLEHKVVQREIPDDGWQFAGWNFVAQRN